MLEDRVIWGVKKIRQTSKHGGREHVAGLDVEEKYEGASDAAGTRPESGREGYQGTADRCTSLDRLRLAQVRDSKRLELPRRVPISPDGETGLAVGSWVCRPPGARVPVPTHHPSPTAIPAYGLGLSAPEPRSVLFGFAGPFSVSKAASIPGGFIRRVLPARFELEIPSSSFILYPVFRPSLIDHLLEVVQPAVLSTVKPGPLL